MPESWMSEMIVLNDVKCVVRWVMDDADPICRERRRPQTSGEMIMRAWCLERPLAKADDGELGNFLEFWGCFFSFFFSLWPSCLSVEPVAVLLSGSENVIYWIDTPRWPWELKKKKRERERMKKENTDISDFLLVFTEKVWAGQAAGPLECAKQLVGHDSCMYVCDGPFWLMHVGLFACVRSHKRGFALRLAVWVEFQCEP